MQNRKSYHRSCQRLLNVEDWPRAAHFALSLFALFRFWQKQMRSLLTKQWQSPNDPSRLWIAFISFLVPLASFLPCFGGVWLAEHSTWSWLGQSDNLPRLLRLPKDQTPSVPSRTGCAGLSQTHQTSPDKSGGILKLKVKHLFEDFITSQGAKANDMTHRHTACLTLWDKDSCWWPWCACHPVTKREQTVTATRSAAFQMVSMSNGGFQ